MAMFRCSGGGDKEYAQLSPSDSSPASISAGTYYEATGNGYAVEDVHELTPTGAPEYVPSGNIEKFNGNGYVVDDIDLVTPKNDNPPKIDSHTSCYNKESYDGYLVRGPVSIITPSNSSPDAISNGGVYAADGAGYAIESYRSITPSSTQVTVSNGDVVKFGGNGVVVDAPLFDIITPSNSTPPQLTANGAYSVTSAGYAIASYSSKTPSDSNPPSVSSGEIVKTGGAGYLCENPGFPYTKSGTIPDFTSINQEQSVDTGLTSVKYIYVEGTTPNGATLANVWVDTDKAFSKQVSVYGTSSAINCTHSASDATGVITANNRYMKVSAISGGTITVKSGNETSYQYKNVKWYAG